MAFRPNIHVVPAIAGPSAHEIGWLAGIMDGEGTIRLKAAGKTIKGKRYVGYKIRLSIPNTNIEIVCRYMEITGMGSIHEQHTGNPKHKTVFVWEASSLEAVAVLNLISPYLVAKKAQSNLVMQASHLIGSRGSGPNHNLEELEGIKQKIHLLNKKGESI